MRLPRADIIDMEKVIAETLPAVLTDTVHDARANGLDHPVLPPMIEMLNVRSELCARVLETATD